MSFLPIPLPVVGDIASKLHDQEKPRGNGTTSAAAPIVGTVASRWRELHGENSWKGLLDPLDLHLRATIISYGEMVQATYDGFNTERRSPHCGACFYGHDDLLAGVGVPHHANNYQVTKFVYATSSLPLPESFLLLPLPSLPDVWSRESNWMGYVAVATDEGAAALGRRDIVVAWRGTIKNLEWVNDLDFTPVPAAPVLGSAASQNRFAVVHRGFLSVYTSSNKSSEFTKTSAKEQQVLKEVRRLVELYKDEEVSITVCGHSLGASLATLNAVDLVSSGANKPESSTKSFPVTAIVFASPHVGDRFFRSAFNSFPDLKALHVQNAGDIVPMYPPLGYVDVAVELTIRTIRSPYMRMPATVLTLHNLECYLHGVAGEQGSAGGFKLEVERDVALVNKGVDALTNEHPVPAEWWVPKHKFMVKGKDGRWTLQDFKHI
uniref:Phospholipase A1 n=1 Tax=Aegilops tauschii subsp. strangulata TaxID=200361 RepID=A0A452Z635_AEGTS